MKLSKTRQCFKLFFTGMKNILHVDVRKYTIFCRIFRADIFKVFSPKGIIRYCGNIHEFLKKVVFTTVSPN